MTGQKIANLQKEVQIKIAKKILDIIILQLLNNHPMHGYEIITKLRKTFGVYFGPSTVYPLLATLEQKTYISSHWDTANERPRKIYILTPDGHEILNFAENTLNQICQKITSPDTTDDTTCFTEPETDPKTPT